MKNITGFILGCITPLLFSSVVVADDHAPEATMDGAFTTLMVAAPDVGKYVASIKKTYRHLKRWVLRAQVSV